MRNAGQRHRQRRLGQQKRVLALVLRRTVVDECDVQEITLHRRHSFLRQQATANLIFSAVQACQKLNLRLKAFF